MFAFGIRKGRRLIRAAWIPVAYFGDFSEIFAAHKKKGSDKTGSCSLSLFYRKGFANPCLDISVKYAESFYAFYLAVNS